ncbi:unnamed protein product [Orchesella dallaii]|uniref:Peptidase M10 metallopeptidase domain-containing protein n=1 Tax=Orchesella dallaii TaxID=48710 RepID=A0ABP1RZ16_9HEXA
MLGGREQVDKEIQRAFTVWENVTNLTFKQNQIDDVDIEISFESGEHGIGEAFDGRGGVLAHTLYGQKPTISPQITTPLVSTVNSTSSSATTTLEYAGRILAINFEGKTFNDSRITTSKPETTRAIPAKFMARTDIPERDKDLAFGQRDWTTHTNVGIAVVVIVLVFLTAVSKIYYKTFVRNDAADNNYFDND